MDKEHEKDCQGRCAKCGSDNIEYGNMGVDGTELWYEYDCDDCGDSGSEYYTLKYDCSISDEQHK
tara:strand:- start:1914 stop:2108 length:195 start_codon:yes stop_codon:yes gene_type:complete